MRSTHPAPERLTLENTDLHGLPLVRANGEIDLYNVAAFEDSMRQAALRGTDAVAVDLTGVAYLDSSGLSALIIAYKALGARGAKLYVIAPPEAYAIRRVLEITRVDEFILVRDSLDAVISDLGEVPVA